MEEIITQIRKYLKLDIFQDEDISPYILLAEKELTGLNIIDDDIIQAKAIKTIILIAPLLWLKLQQRVNEYNESIETFKDVKTFQSFWEDRLRSLIQKKPSVSSFSFGAV